MFRRGIGWCLYFVNLRFAILSLALAFKESLVGVRVLFPWKSILTLTDYPALSLVLTESFPTALNIALEDSIGSPF